MKTFLSLALMVAALATSYAATTDTPLSVTILPDTPYTATATITTPDVAGLLADLAGGQSPLQFLDDQGHVIGELTAQQLTDLLTGLTGAVSKVIEIPLDPLTTATNTIVQRTLDTSTLQVPRVLVRSDRSRDHRPSVAIKHSAQRGKKLVLRGTAKDDFKVEKVEVTRNHHEQFAEGTNHWHIVLRLKKGTNHIRVRAIDSGHQFSPAKRMTVKR